MKTAIIIIALLVIIGGLVAFIFMRKSKSEVALEIESDKVKKTIKANKKEIKKREGKLDEIKEELNKKTNGTSASDHIHRILFGKRPNS